MICMLAAGQKMHAQVEWESQLWTSAEFNYNFKGPWSVSLAPEVRFRTNPFMVRTVFPDIAAGYNITKQLSAALHYRYQFTNEGMGNNYYNHSVLTDLVYKLKQDRFQYGIRFRAGTVEDENPNPELLQWQSWEAREKITVSYKLNKKLETYSSIEFFQLPVVSWTELQQLRIGAGIEIELSKSQQLEIGLMFQDKTSVKRLNPLITYSLDLDRLKKKKP